MRAQEFVKPGITEGAGQKPIIIYTNNRGATIDDDIKKSLPVTQISFDKLHMWESHKSMEDPKVADWVNNKLLPELEQNGILKPLLVWNNNGEFFVIDGNHRFIAYQEAGYQGRVPVQIVPDNMITVSDTVPGQQGMAENKAAGINKMFNNLGDPVYANLQRVALLAMQGRQQEAAGRLQTVIKDADPAVQKKITDAVNNIKPVTINGKIADSSTLDKSKQHNDWIINTFIPWVQSLLGQQGVAEGSEQISEYRDRLLQYVKSLLPTWPEYVLKDWLVPNKGNFSNLPTDAIKNGIMEKLKGAGFTPNTKWQLVPDMKFTMDMFDPKTKQLLIGRAGGSSDLGMGIPKDKERHATQAALAQQQGGVRKEPVLLIKTDKGYELLEGWHRTIQHFAKYPNGYTGPAYVAVAQQGVAEGFLGEADAAAVQFRTASTDNYQNSFTVTAIADGKNVGHFSFFRDPETDDVHNQAEVTDNVRGKGYGKALLLKAIEVANDHGLGFQEDSQSLSRAQSRVYDSLYDAGWIVDADGYWFLTPEGEQELARLSTMQQGVTENFADGKNPERKGLAKRSGVDTKASVSSLRKTAKNSSGEKQRMAHWLANMKAGRAKAKRK